MNQSDRIFLLLSEAGRLLSAEATREARAQGLSRAQWTILDILEQAPGLTQREIAERLDVEPITVARMLDRLSARDVIERRPDPRDRRVWRIHLSEDGARIREMTADRRAALGREITSGLPDEVTQALERGLTHAVAALEADTSLACTEVV